MQKTWKFHIITFGCKVNQYESQAIHEAWLRGGFLGCQKLEEAEIIVVNSCAITAKGERDARQMLARLRRRAPEAKLVLTGCAAALVSGQNAEPKWDLIFAPAEKALLLQPELLLQKLGLEQPEAKPDKPCEHWAYPPFHITSYQRARPVLKVQDGCTHRCTYCIVPSLRGKATSRPVAEVVQEARNLLAKGYAELIISGINLKQYGRDRSDGKDFWDLLSILDRELCDFAGRARLRISSVEPSQLHERGLNVLSSCRMLCPQLHISLQHASQRILRRMGRGHYTGRDLAQAIQGIQSFWPKFGLGCDLISGFPGEEEDDHAELLAFCQEIPFTYAHVFPYSPRPGTAAASFPGRIEEKIQARRALELRKLFQEKNRRFRQKLLEDKTPLEIALEGKRERGICQYYVACSLIDAEQVKPHTGLLRVSPKALTAEGLAVSIEPSRAKFFKPQR